MKIAYLFFLFFSFELALYASLSAKVDTKTVEAGDMLTFSLNISGETIKRPNITRLCGTEILSTSSQTNMQMINGTFSKSYILSYKIAPQKSCTIEPIEVEIDGKKELSSAIDIEVAPAKVKTDGDFILMLESTKERVFVGETFDVVLIFRQKKETSALDSEFSPPEFDGFWVKNESKPQKYEEGNYINTKIVYTLAAQRAGKAIVKNAKIKIASQTPQAQSWGVWIPTVKWKNYFSNEVVIEVEPLPEGVVLVGNFKINIRVEKTAIEANEALNAKIEVEGNGNLEDIESFKPHIEGVSIFDEKSVVEGSKLTQNLTFVSGDDFTIPSFGIKYFDIKTKEVKEIRTKEIPISITNKKPQEELLIKKSTNTDEDVKDDAMPLVTSSIFLSVAIFLFGLIIGVLITLYKEKLFIKKEKKSSIKEPKVLLSKLLNYKNDDEVKEVIEILEKNIYQHQNIEIDKKLLKEILKRYNL
ncbi:MAG: hypothetical protein QG559_1518 [Campylobacterota bacterium]|nr:hypothetical protein [Campylobacterota bacterium]